MKQIIACTAIVVAQFLLVHGASADKPTVEQSAREFQLQRFEAMVNADVESLEQYLADDLTYSHTTGWTETKSGFLKTVASGKIDYIAMTPIDVEVRVYGDVAVMTGRSIMKGAVGDRTVSFTIRFLDVSRRNGDSWQLVAWQSVKMPDDQD